MFQSQDIQSAYYQTYKDGVTYGVIVVVAASIVYGASVCGGRELPCERAVCDVWCVPTCICILCVARCAHTAAAVAVLVVLCVEMFNAYRTTRVPSLEQRLAKELASAWRGAAPRARAFAGGNACLVVS